jgi:hypothetical protein
MHTRTQKAEQMVCTQRRHKRACKMSYTPPHTQMVDRTSGGTRKRRRADKFDTLGSRLRKHRACNSTVDGTLRTRNHSMGDGTWRNRRRRS